MDAVDGTILFRALNATVRLKGFGPSTGSNISTHAVVCDFDTCMTDAVKVDGVVGSTPAAPTKLPVDSGLKPVNAATLKPSVYATGIRSIGNQIDTGVIPDDDPPGNKDHQGEWFTLVGTRLMRIPTKTDQQMFSRKILVTPALTDNHCRAELKYSNSEAFQPKLEIYKPDLFLDENGNAIGSLAWKHWLFSCK